MDMVIFFSLLLCVIAFVVFLVITILSILRKKSWRKSAYISGGLLVASFLLFVFFGTSITDEDKVMSEQMSTIQSQKNSIEEYEVRIDELESEVETLNGEVEASKKDDNSGENKELANTVATLEQDIENKDEEINKLSKASNDSKELSAENKKLTSEVATLTKANEDLSKQIKEFKVEAEKEPAAEKKDKAKKEPEEKNDDKEVAADEKKTPEQNIEDAVLASNNDIESVTIEKEGELFKPTVTIDGTDFSFFVEQRSKNAITDAVYALKESEYKYGFITVEVEMNFIDKFGNEDKGTGYKAEFTQEILDKLSEDIYSVRDREMIDQVANYWFKHPGIE